MVWYDNKHAVDKHMCTGGEGENICDLEEEEEDNHYSGKPVK